jgi:hypothetical protein
MWRIKELSIIVVVIQSQFLLEGISREKKHILGNSTFGVCWNIYHSNKRQVVRTVFLYLYHNHDISFVAFHPISSNLYTSPHRQLFNIRITAFSITSTSFNLCIIVQDSISSTSGPPASFISVSSFPPAAFFASSSAFRLASSSALRLASSCSRMARLRAASSSSLRKRSWRSASSLSK